MKILGSYKPELKKTQENPLKKYLTRDDLIFVLRHGRIDGYDEKKRFIGQTDVLLGISGIEQAKYWGEILSVFSFNHAFTGSLKRSIYTAENLGLDISFERYSSLNEINLGKLEGLSFEYVKENFPLEFSKRGEHIDVYRPEKGESFSDLLQRTVPFFQKIEKLEGNCLVVTHAGVIRTLLASIKKINLKEIFSIGVDYGELFILEKYNC